MQNCICNGLVYCTGVVYIPHCFYEGKGTMENFQVRYSDGFMKKKNGIFQVRYSDRNGHMFCVLYNYIKARVTT